MSEAIQYLFKNEYPRNVQTDLGKEFYNKDVKKIFDKYSINHYSVYSIYKAAVVERFNRTLRGRLTKYFTKQGNKKWIDVLPKIIFAYNHSEHSSLKKELRPVYISSSNEMQIWFNRNKINVNKKPKYKVGDVVRLSKLKLTPLIKNFDQNWSDEVFEIIKIDMKDLPIMYHIKDNNDNKVEGKFYEEELQVLPEKPKIFRIQEIIKSKGKGKNKQYLVKWHGYKETSWIKAIDIQ
jgi:hypothetical protein